MNNLHEDFSQRFNDNIFMNTRYKNEFNSTKTLIVDVKGPTSDENNVYNVNLTKDGKFSVKLPQTLNIDKTSEVFLNSFVTFNADVVDSSEKSSFLLNIDQFNINTVGASDENKSTDSSNLNNIENDKFLNKIVIPNENRNVQNYLTTISHKSKKLNYVCDINPSRINVISGSITNMQGKPIFASNDSENSLVYTLLNITTSNSPEWSKMKSTGTAIEPKPSNEKFFINSGTEIKVYCTGTSIDSTPNEEDLILHGHVISNVNKDSSVIYLSSSPLPDSLGDKLYSKGTDVNFVIKLIGIKYPGHSSTFDDLIHTKNITILESECRFIAEFNIIEKNNK